MRTPDADPRQALQLWQRFQTGQCAEQEIEESLVLQRWKRCLDAGLSADNPGEPRLVLAGLAEAVDRFAPLLAPGAPFDAFASSLARDGFCSVFCDNDGRVLSSRVSEPFEATVVSKRLIEGAVWSESARGTNGIGTTLVEGRPTAILGSEHFEQRNHVFACYAAPIRDVRERIVAVLDATGPASRAGGFIHASVVAAAVALEALIIGRTYDAAHPGGLFELERQLDGMPHAAMLLESTGRLRRSNALFRGLVPASDEAMLTRVLLGLSWRRPGDRLKLSVPAARSFRDLDVEFEPIGSGNDPFAAIVHLRHRRLGKPAAAPLHDAGPFKPIVGSDPAIVAARAQASRFAASDLPVLILGETGTGKELFARALHAAGPRGCMPFVAVNAGTLTGNLLESELFGYVSGAFTGATPGGRAGKLETANGGTLFLDEIGEMSPPVQAMLLRFLEDGKFYRVGDATERFADVRLMAATNRNLQKLVNERDFRSDLFYRLRGVVLRLPALKDRSDRRELANALLERIAKKRKLAAVPTLSPAAFAWIERHGWPGNVREMRTALEYAVVLAAGARRIDLWHLPVEQSESIPGGDLLSSAEREALLRALEASRGNMSAAARQLGVARSTLYRMLERHGLRS